MKIVMVCTGNTCRSPMAEAMLRDALSRAGAANIAVGSAGLCAHPGAPMSGGAMGELDRRGLPYYRTRATRLTQELTEGALVLCMTAWHLKDVKRLFPGTRAMTLNQCAGLSGDVDDPYGGGENAYRRAADQIGRAVLEIARRLVRGEIPGV